MMSGIKILIVEDERHITKFLEFILNKQGYDLLTVGNGADALKALAGFRPDAVLLDLGLPDISGLDLLREIRADKTQQNTRVIVLSATLYEGLSDQLRESGADAQCSKPVAPSTLLRTLRNFNFAARPACI
jgi:DNA-binding response OmpR family regulator